MWVERVSSTRSPLSKSSDLDPWMCVPSRATEPEGSSTRAHVVAMMRVCAVADGSGVGFV